MIPRIYQVALATMLVLAVTGSPAVAATAVPSGSSVLAGGVIPRNLEEALRRLEATLPPQQTEAIRAGNTSPVWWDHTVGPQVLKNWVEPPNSPLTAYFRSLGIDHPQDISGILRHSFYLYLNHRLTPRDLQMEVRFRENYWERLLTSEKAAAAEKLSAQAEHDPALIQKAYELDAKLVSNDLLDTLNHPALSVPLELDDWRIMDEWLLQQTAQRTSLNADDYENIVVALDPTIQVRATLLEPHVMLISTDQGGIGRVIIVTAELGKPPQLWRIDANLPIQGPDAEALRCWRPTAGIRPCAAQVIGSLPPDARGMPRFYIQAGYAQSAGGTRGNQLSVWLWDGRAATPIYVSSYTTGGDAEGQGVSVDGDTIRIGAKSQFKAFWSCGSCDGRQVAHRFRLLLDNHVVDLGTMSLMPELDVIDEIYSDIRDDQPTGTLVSAPALSLMKQSWKPMIGRKLRSLFINTEAAVTHDADQTLVCFHANYDLDRSMHPILFTIESSGRQLTILKAQQDDPNCPADRWEQSRLVVP